MRNLSLATLFCCSIVSVYSASVLKEAKVELIANVESEVGIKRTDSNGTLDILNPKDAAFTVWNNDNKNVKITFQTDNNETELYLIKENDKSKKIPYELNIRGDSLNETIQENNKDLIIEQNKFGSNLEYNFTLKPQLKSGENSCKYAAGTYKGTITIKVEVNM